jgi:hypothetical protein
MKWLAVLIALLVLPATAYADVEPNDHVFQAEGPVTGGAPIPGTIFNDADDDWYLAYVSSQTQTDVVVASTTTGCSLQARLYDGDLGRQASETLSSEPEIHLRYTTPPGTTRMFVRVSGWLGTCANEPYTVTLNPAPAYVTGEPASGGTPVPEPNEAPEQAAGPLAGGLIHSGALETVNDTDWLYFHTAGPAELDIPVTEPFGNCSVDAALYSAADPTRSLTSVSPSFQVEHLRYRAPGAGTYLVRLSHWITACPGVSYQLRVFPAEALTATPPPATGVAAPSTSARVRGSKVRIVLKGRLGVPAGVDAGRACNGSTIVFSIKKGKRLISARTVKLTRSCRFNKTVNLSRSKVGSARRLKITARFQGTALLSGTTKNFSVRVRR